MIEFEFETYCFNPQYLVTLPVLTYYVNQLVLGQNNILTNSNNIEICVFFVNFICY